MILTAAGDFGSIEAAFKEKTPAVHEINWKWRNQRQDRKARRQAFSNGDRRAFKR